eukprot:9873073-Prorocentrum_lima.AAC.1
MTKWSIISLLPSLVVSGQTIITARKWFSKLWRSLHRGCVWSSREAANNLEERGMAQNSSPTMYTRRVKGNAEMS